MCVYVYIYVQIGILSSNSHIFPDWLFHVYNWMHRFMWNSRTSLLSLLQEMNISLDVPVESSADDDPYYYYYYWNCSSNDSVHIISTSDRILWLSSRFFRVWPANAVSLYIYNTATASSVRTKHVQTRSNISKRDTKIIFHYRNSPSPSSNMWTECSNIWLHFNSWISSLVIENTTANSSQWMNSICDPSRVHGWWETREDRLSCVFECIAISTYLIATVQLGNTRNGCPLVGGGGHGTCGDEPASMAFNVRSHHCLPNGFDAEVNSLNIIIFNSERKNSLQFISTFTCVIICSR